jgi:hypothetical protein
MQANLQQSMSRILVYQGVRKISKGPKKEINGGVGMNHCLGLALRNSWLLLILAFTLVSSSAQATLADCPACKGEQPDWTESAISFLEGKPTQDASSTLSGPKQARMLNAQIDARKKASLASNAADDTATKTMYNSTATFGIYLFETRALPNPAKINDTVKIIAVFSNSSSTSTLNESSSKMMDLTHLTAYADIKDSEGLDAGKVHLNPSLVNTYSGIWNANVELGVYNATIEVSGPDGSKTFKDVLQIVVKDVN